MRAAATAWLLWYMVRVPGVSYAGALGPLSEEEKVLAASLRGHVAAIASREHNVFQPAALEASAQYIESTFARLGLAVATQRFRAGPAEVRNIEVEVSGGPRAAEIVSIPRPETSSPSFRISPRARCCARRWPASGAMPGFLPKVSSLPYAAGYTRQGGLRASGAGGHRAARHAA